MPDTIKSYRDLRVWQSAIDVAAWIYKLTEAFPKSEMYGLVNQMRRAAVSIASNIAEGYVRSTAEFARFLQIALGSLAELETQLEIALRVGYVTAKDFEATKQQLDNLGKPLMVLLKSIQNKQ